MTGDTSASVLVPATTANLGGAFDCAAIAVTLYLRVSASPKECGFELAYRGTNAGQIPCDESNLVVQAMRHVAAWAKGNLQGARVVVENEIPLGVGLGSSAAAIMAGILLGAELSRANLKTGDALRLALEMEHHPDNIAAALHGGMVVS